MRRAAAQSLFPAIETPGEQVAPQPYAALPAAIQAGLGFATYLVEMSAQIAMTVLLYELLKPVSRGVSLLSAVFGLTGCAIKIVSRLFYYAPLLVLSGTPYLDTFKREQLDTLALLFLQINDQGAGIGLALFRLATLLKGYLILRSAFLPRFLACSRWPAVWAG